MRRGRAAAILAAALLAGFGQGGQDGQGAHLRAEPAEGLSAGGSFAQAVTLRHDPAASFPDATPRAGTASDLSLTLETGGREARVRVDTRLSLLSGADSDDAWAELALAGGRTGALIAPAWQGGTAAPAALAVFKIEQAYLSLSGSGLEFAAGRVPVNFGVGKAFSPVDLFSAFDYSGALPRRLAADAFRAAYYPAPLVAIELAAAPQGRAASGRLATGQSGRPLTALRMSASGQSGFAGGLLAARDGEPWLQASSHAWLAGVEASLDLPFATLYAEATARFADGAAASDARWEMMGGIDASPGEAVVLVEYLHAAGPGAAGPAGLYSRIALPLDDWSGIAASVLWGIDSGALSASVLLQFEGLLGADFAFSTGAARSPDALGGAWSFAAGVLATLAF